MKKIIETGLAPAPIGPYSQAVRVGDMIFLSGQIALDPISGELVQTNLEAETRQVMKNIGAVLAAENLDFSNIVKTSIFLKNMDDFQEINAIYGEFFPENPPARECVQVARLPKDVNVEITVIAVA